MTNRERIAAALRGGKPDRVPFTAYEWMWKDEEKVRELIKRGLGPTRHVETCRRLMPDVTFEEESFEREGRPWQRTLMRTPVGTLERLRKEGWVQQYFVREPRDYEVVEWVARHTELEPNYGAFLAEMEKLGDDGILIVSGHRTPIQEIMVELVGIKNFCYHLADEVEELHRCHEAMVERTFREFEVIAEGPGEFVKLWENFTDEPFGPERFLKFHMPVYERVSQMLHAKGKRLAAHTDGWLSRVAGLIPDTGIDILESLTPPSEGDVPPEQWRSLWPGTVYWSNIPVSWYLDPPAKLAERLQMLLEKIGETAGLVFEISEDLPRNWPESIPVVLDVLERWGAP